MQRSSLMIAALACALPLADPPAAALPVPAHVNQARDQPTGQPASDPFAAPRMFPVLAVRADMEGAEEAVRAIRRT